MFCRWSTPWERIVATSRDRPKLASQAENVIKIMGDIEKIKVLNFKIHRESEMKRVSIIPSRHRSAERR